MPHQTFGAICDRERTMKRRRCFGLVAGAVAWPFVATAQQGAGMRRLGVLAGYAANDSLGQLLAAILPRGLAALGWSEGQNIYIDWRWASGDPKLYESYAAEVVALRPDVLVVQSSPAVAALRRSDNAIPTVFVMITDPLGQGFVNNLAHPAGHMIGFSDYDPPIASKWVELLKQIKQAIASIFTALQSHVHAFRRSHPPGRPAGSPLVSGNGALLGLSRRCGHRRRDETCARRARRRAGDAGSFTTVHRDTIVAAAARHRVPAIYPDEISTTRGELMSYGMIQPTCFCGLPPMSTAFSKGKAPATCRCRIRPNSR